MDALKLFISYAHEDEAYRDALQKYLTVLKINGVIEEWDDRKLVPGDKWEDEINASLESSHVIVLLVSINFIGSEFIRTQEMRRAMERHGTGSAVVVPVLVRVTPEWTNVLGLGTLQALPVKPGAVPEEIIPIKKWADDDEAWTCVVSGLRKTMEKFRKAQEARAAAAPTTAATESAAAPEPKLRAATTATVVSADGLKALRALMADADVHAAADRFRRDFAEASQHIVALGDYKDLHDALHDLHFQCYSFALQESRRTDPDAVNWDNLIQAETVLSRILETIREVAKRPTLAPAETSFVGDLETASCELHALLDTNDFTQIKPPVRRMGRVLTLVPSRINLRLSDTARGLPLVALAESMAKMRGQLKDTEMASEEGQRFDQGVAAMALLRTGVQELCAEHDAWQEIDSEMRRIEGGLGQDLGDLEFSWEGLRKKLMALCADPSEAWASELAGEVGKLDAALAAGVGTRTIQAFKRSYSKAGARFYNVDFELKGLCDELRKVGTELDKILAKL